MTAHSPIIADQSVFELHQSEVARLKSAGVLGDPSDLFLPNSENYPSLVGAEKPLHSGETELIFEGTFDQIAADVLDILAARIALDNRLKGFWPDGTDPMDTHKLALYPTTLGRNPSEALALVHSEVSEALEAIRSSDHGGFEVRDDKLTDESQFAVELTDDMIRCLDMGGGFKLGLGRILLKKLIRNRSRPYKHGRAF